MKKFELPFDLKFNTGFILDPETYFKESNCESWLCLIGEEFAKMENGLSFQQVQAITNHSVNVVSDPPFVLNLDLAKQHVAALDILPRPTLISCRKGPRSSAVAYMYSGLKQGASVEEVISKAEINKAPFAEFDEYKEWVRSSIITLRNENSEY